MKWHWIIISAYVVIAGAVILATPLGLALEHDAGSYYATARKIYEEKSIVESFFSSSPQFIDHGYPTAIALTMLVAGPDNIIAIQIMNYLYWLLVAMIVYHVLRLMKTKRPEVVASLTLLSPLYTTFSGKIYSEPFASLGTALIMYAFVTIKVLKYHPPIVGKCALTLGCLILFSTKSVLLPGIFLLGIYITWRRRFDYLPSLIIVLVMLTPRTVGALGGGRSLYTMNIQSSKATQQITQIIACVPYYLSYPLGQKLLPEYQGTCHQNDPSPTMPGYAENPYVVAEVKRAGGYTYFDWIRTVGEHPFRYLLVMVVSLANIVFFEGVYPSILLQLPLVAAVPLFVLAKIGYSILIWYKVIAAGVKNRWLLVPLLYFALVVTHFPIEPRYFYPFIPYMYFVYGVSLGKDTDQ